MSVGHAAVPAAAFGGWPDGLALQVHVHDQDEPGDVDDARALTTAVPDAELFLSPGSTHLLTDTSPARSRSSGGGPERSPQPERRP